MLLLFLQQTSWMKMLVIEAVEILKPVLELHSESVRNIGIEIWNSSYYYDYDYVSGLDLQLLLVWMLYTFDPQLLHPKKKLIALL